MAMRFIAVLVLRPARRRTLLQPSTTLAAMGASPTTTRPRLSHTAALLVGTGINGLAAYAFIIIGTRAIGADAFAPVSLLWTIWSVAVAVLTFPVQHWIISTIRADGAEDEVAGLRRSLVLVSLGLGALVFVVTAVGRTTLFDDGGLAYPLIAGLLVPGSVAAGFMRGVQVGRDQLLAAAVGLAGENLLRVVLAGAVVAIGGGPVAFAAALLAGFGIVFAYPGCFRLRSAPIRATGHSLRRTYGVLASVSGGSTLAQVILTCGPVALAVAGGGADQVTSVFAACSVFRAPYLAATGASLQLTSWLTGLVVDGDAAAWVRTRVVMMATTVVGAIAAGGFGLLVGAALLRALFGPSVQLDPLPVALIASANVIALGTLVETLMLVARRRTRGIPVSWCAAGAVFVAVVAVPWGEPVVRVAAAFVAAEAVALLAMLAALRDAPPAAP
jgi:O-antigen/teichoic acid export membrane protein